MSYFILPYPNKLKNFDYEKEKTDERRTRELTALRRWCNDNDHAVSWKCADFAAHAQWVRDKCTWWDGKYQSDRTWGQAFDEQGFNVLVGYERC